MQSTDYIMGGGEYSIITPYLLPPGSPKAVNAGDGFILDSCQKLICKPAVAAFSARAPLDDAAIEQINDTRCVVVAGANTLRDDFSPTPGFDLSTLARLRVPVVLFGLGHYGVPQVTQGLQPQAVQLLEALLERFAFMSVRCDRSKAYIDQSAPQLAGKVLMTSCPVIYEVDGIDKGFVAKEQYEQLVVTVTDRANLQAQLPLLLHATQAFPAETRVLALHQDYRNQPLHDFAKKHGYEVFTSPRYEDYLALYRQSDLHFGNRVHGHLKALSFGVRSFLTPFDLRQAFFSESLDFPLITQLPSEEFSGYDFARFTVRRETIRPQMERFVAAIQALLE